MSPDDWDDPEDDGGEIEQDDGMGYYDDLADARNDEEDDEQ